MSEKLTKEQIEAWKTEAAYTHEEVLEIKFTPAELSALCDLALAGLEVQPRPIEEYDKNGTQCVIAVSGEVKCTAAFFEGRWHVCTPNTDAEKFWNMEPWVSVGSLPFVPTHFIPLSSLPEPKCGTASP